MMSDNRARNGTLGAILGAVIAVALAIFLLGGGEHVGKKTVNSDADLPPPSPSGWPSRVVKLVVPFTPGGGIDAIGRILGARLSEMWGQQLVIENKPGAGGNIASEFVARSAPDGYTMYISAAGLAVNRYL